MLQEAEILALRADVRHLHRKLDSLNLLLMQRAKAGNALGGWVSEKDAISLTGLGRTRLRQLRAEGKVLCSSLGGKALWYRVSDFKELLNKNARLR